MRQTQRTGGVGQKPDCARQNPRFSFWPLETQVQYPYCKIIMSTRERIRHHRLADLAHEVRADKKAYRHVAEKVTKPEWAFSLAAFVFAFIPTSLLATGDHNAPALVVNATVVMLVIGSFLVGKAGWMSFRLYRGAWVISKAADALCERFVSEAALITDDDDESARQLAESLGRARTLLERRSYALVNAEPPEKSSEPDQGDNA